VSLTVLVLFLVARAFAVDFHVYSRPATGRAYLHLQAMAHDGTKTVSQGAEISEGGLLAWMRGRKDNVPFDTNHMRAAVNIPGAGYASLYVGDRLPWDWGRCGP